MFYKKLPKRLNNKSIKRFYDKKCQKGQTKLPKRLKKKSPKKVQLYLPKWLHKIIFKELLIFFLKSQRKQIKYFQRDFIFFKKVKKNCERGSFENNTPKRLNEKFKKL